MDLAIILTYRCNSKCSMCDIWKFPTLPKEEITLETMEKIPEGIDYLNLTGGEPTLRTDLLEICDLLYPKAMKLEISTNGLHANKLIPIVKKYPDIKIRISLEGFGKTNVEIRGEKDGFNKKMKGLLSLKEAGGTDLGFGTVIQDDNISELVDLYRLCKKHDFEFATSALHNGWQFHKSDNIPYERLKLAHGIEHLITEQMKSFDIKTWFRGYLNLGLIAKVLGHDRILKCTATTDFIFLDPWCDVYACNVRPDLKFGNLSNSTWDKIMNSDEIKSIHKEVYQCKQNCWMVGSAKTAMRHPKFAKIPKGGPLYWVIKNKFKILFGYQINFSKYIDYSNVYHDKNIPKRKFYLHNLFKKRVVYRENEKYNTYGDFFNK